MADKIVGVIGGMGPEATVDLMRRVIYATPAKDEIDHIRMVIDSNPKIPSRIKAIIEGTGESPAPYMVEIARNLSAYGAEFLAIPCNTAHCYYDEVRSAVDIPILNMVELTVESVIKQNPGIRTVGLLASTAVLKTALYMGRFKEKGVDTIYPSAGLQDQIMASIGEIKTGRYGREVEEALRSAADELIGKKAEVLIVACTELSIISHAIDTGVKLYDASQVLAEGIVRMARGEE